jgi:hypothetical protein
MPVGLAAKFAKVTDETVRNWMRDKPDFLAQVEYARAVAAGSLIKKVTEDSNGAWKVLKNLQPNYFRDEVEVHETHETIITIEGTDGRQSTIQFGAEIKSGANGSLLRGNGSNPIGYLGDSGGEDHSGHPLDAEEDKQKPK